MIHYDNLLQNSTVILLQNATEVYHKMRQVFLLQNETVITNCDDFITKSNSYYKMRGLLQIVIVQVSFDVKSFFTNVPLEMTTDLKVRRIYEIKELKR